MFLFLANVCFWPGPCHSFVEAAVRSVVRNDVFSLGELAYSLHVCDLLFFLYFLKKASY